MTNSSKNTRDSLEYSSRSVWPIVVGVATIAFTGANVVRLIVELVFRAMAIYGTQGTRHIWQLPGALDIGRYFWYAVFVVTLVLSAAALIRRRPAARFYLMIWSVLYIVYAVIFRLQELGLYYDAETARLAGAHVFRLLANGAADIAPAVFLLIWFSRKKVKEQIDSWADQSGDGQPAASAADQSS